MKIRLICSSCCQVGPDSWNMMYKTFDIPVPDSVVRADEKHMDWLHGIVGAELIEEEGKKDE